jgi:hypothetical protein
MVPRWAIFVGIALALVWMFTDPAGFGQFLNDAGNNIKIFFKNLG